MMEHITLLLGILGIHILAVVSPGPDFVIAVKNSLMYSRKTAMWTAVGFGLGIAVHITYCVLGLALLISQSIMLFTVIKRLGGLYLIWIGVQALLSKGSGALRMGNVEKKDDISWKIALKEGFLTNVLNPKATLFFLGLFTIVISPTTPFRVIAVASSMMVINITVWFCLVSVFFTNSLIRKKVEKWQAWIVKSLGGALIALGGLILIKE